MSFSFNKNLIIIARVMHRIDLLQTTMFFVHLCISIAFVSIDIDFRVKWRIQLRTEIKRGQLDILRDCLMCLPTS